MRRAPRLLAAALLSLVALIACGCRSQPPLPRRIIDLSPPLTPDLDLRRLGSRTLSFLGAEGRIQVSPLLPAYPEFAFGIDVVSLMSHSGSHVDAPARLLRGGDRPMQISLDRLVGPARLTDLRWHDRHTQLQISDLELTTIFPGDVVLLFLGYEPPFGDKWPQYAPLSPQAAEWLVAKRIRALATDIPTLVTYEVLETRLRKHQPPEEVWAEYLPLMQAQIPIISGLVNLDALTDESKVVFAGLPLPLSDATGAPLRAVALVY